MTWPMWLKPTVWLAAVCHIGYWFPMGLRLMAGRRTKGKDGS